MASLLTGLGLKPTTASLTDVLAAVHNSHHDLSTRLDAMHHSQQDLTTQLTGLSDALHGELDAVKGKVDVLHTRVNTLNDSVEQHTTAIDQHGVAISRLQAEIAQLQEGVQAMSEELAIVKHYLVQLVTNTRRTNLMVFALPGCTQQLSSLDATRLAGLLRCRAQDVRIMGVGKAGTSLIVKCSTIQVKGGILSSANRNFVATQHHMRLLEDLHQLEHKDKQVLGSTMDAHFQKWVAQSDNEEPGPGKPQGLHWRRAVMTWFLEGVMCTLTAEEVKHPITRRLLSEEEINNIIDKKCLAALDIASSAAATHADGAPGPGGDAVMAEAPPRPPGQAAPPLQPTHTSSPLQARPPLQQTPHAPMAQRTPHPHPPHAGQALRSHRQPHPVQAAGQPHHQHGAQRALALTDAPRAHRHPHGRQGQRGQAQHMPLAIMPPPNSNCRPPTPPSTGLAVAQSSTPTSATGPTKRRGDHAQQQAPPAPPVRPGTEVGRGESEAAAGPSAHRAENAHGPIPQRRCA